jgi:hypothetical protein
MRSLAILLLALAPLPALAQSIPDTTPSLKPAAAQSLAGSWALKVDGATVFRFDIERDGDGWKGVWHRPASFASTGDSFSRLSNDSVEVDSGGSKTIGNWAELTFPDNRPHAVPDVFRFRQIGADRLEMIYVDTGLAPFTLMRVTPTAALGPFTAGKVYHRVSVETLGLPSDAEGPPAPVAGAGVQISPARPEPASNLPLPARRTDKPPAEGGR